MSTDFDSLESSLAEIRVIGIVADPEFRRRSDFLNNKIADVIEIRASEMPYLFTCTSQCRVCPAEVILVGSTSIATHVDKHVVPLAALCLVARHGITIFAYHGVNPEEKVDGQNFIFDIDAVVDLRLPCRSDNVDDTVSYAKIIKETVKIFTAQKDDLLERAAERVAQGLFERFEKIQSLRILLKKPEAPIKADFDYVGVEIFRDRKD